MSQRKTCYRCGGPEASGQPPTCEACFVHFFRHDPGSPYYCGGCDDCERVLAEQQRLSDHAGQQVLNLGAVA